MKTLVYKIKSCSDNPFIGSKLNDHAYCTRFIYKKLEEIKDVNLIDYCKQRFNLNDIEIRSIIANVKQIRNSFLAKLKKTEEEIVELVKDIDELRKEISELEVKNKTDLRTKKLRKLKRILFKLNYKLNKKHKFLKSDITFGSKKLLGEISYLSNNKIKNFDKIFEKKEQYLEKRLSSMFIIGEANYKGNRFFEFDLENKIIIYKPNRNTKIVINICNRKDPFEKELMNAINNKQIPITISLNKDKICLSYNEAILVGFSINKSEREKEVNTICKSLSKEDRTDVIKKIYSNYYDHLKQRQLSNKLSNRYIGIDLNPEHIGYSIMDKISETEFKIIKTGSFNFKKLTHKTGKSPNSLESIYLNNKRKHERKEVICELFKIMKHYKVGYFIMEDLNFKSTNKFESKEFNRKVKNIWDRELILNLINKKCTEGGFILEVVNPVYTSLIGNLSYRIFDPIASSLEITRKGATKYNKGCFYPQETASTIHTMEVIAKRNHIDVELIRDATWKERYTILNSNIKFRYRWGEKVGTTESLSLKSYKSKIKHSNYGVVYN